MMKSLNHHKIPLNPNEITMKPAWNYQWLQLSSSKQLRSKPAPKRPTARFDEDVIPWEVIFLVWEIHRMGYKRPGKATKNDGKS